MKFIATVLSILIITLTISFTLINRPPENVSAQATNVDWPQLQSDAAHTGRTSAFVVPNYKAAWVWMDKTHIVKNFVSAPGKSITDGFESGYKQTTLIPEQVQPIVSGGKVFFGAQDGRFYAVDALTGDNRWDYLTGGPILGTAAVSGSTVVVGSMDGKVYFLDASNGSLKGSYQTGAGINAAITIFQTTAYVPSRDGSLYAFDTTNSSLKWKYTTRVNGSETDKFAKAPIVAPAAVSEDGTTVVFGSENMYVYALNTSNGTEKWTPKKVIGQSFLYSWPMIKGNNVIIRTMSSLPGVEQGIIIPDNEPILAAMPADPSWTEEKNIVMNYLNQNPNQKSMYVFNLTNGTEPYQVAMWRVTGNNFVPHISVVDNQDRVLTYWRSKKSTFYLGNSFGTNFCPDLSAMNMATGDRVKITAGGGNIGFCPELDNGFQPTVGGNYLYLGNGFRGVRAVNFSATGASYVTAALAKWDGGDFRGWGAQIIYFGNDSQPTNTTIDPRPVSTAYVANGFNGPAIATTNGVSMLYVNEPGAGAIVGITH